MSSFLKIPYDKGVKEGRSESTGRTDYTGRKVGVWALGKVTQQQLLKAMQLNWIIQREMGCAMFLSST